MEDSVLLRASAALLGSVRTEQQMQPTGATVAPVQCP